MTVDHDVMAVSGTALNDSVHTYLTEMYTLMSAAATEEQRQQMASDFTLPILNESSNC